MLTYIYCVYELFWKGGRYQILCLHHLVPYVVDIRSYVYTTWFPM